MTGCKVVLATVLGIVAAPWAAGQDEIWRVTGTLRRDVGYDMEIVGDLNGDGCRDMLVGAPDNSGYVGYGFVFGLDGKTGAMLFSIMGNETSFGMSVAGLGDDVNGDGVEDFLASGDGSYRGAVLYSGADQSELHAGADDGFLESVADLDGDGIRDFLVGYGDVDAYSSATFARLKRFPNNYSSYDSGIYAVLDDVDRDGVPDLAIGDPDAYGKRGKVTIWSLRTGGKLKELHGTQPGERLGFKVTTAGDLDGDGIGDFVTYALKDTIGGIDGRVAAYSGRTLHTLHELLPEGIDRPISLVGPTAGDVDGDGFHDWFVHYGVDDPGHRYDRAGTTWVVSGKTGTLLVNTDSVALHDAGASEQFLNGGADLDGDGFSDPFFTNDHYRNPFVMGVLRGGPRFLSARHIRVFDDFPGSSGGGTDELGGGSPPPPPPPTPGIGGARDYRTSLVAAGFAPNSPLTILLVAIDGRPVNQPVIVTFTDGLGRFTGTYPDVPTSAHDLELKAIGLDALGQFVSTPSEWVAYRDR